jgi:hypothetical protein
MQLQQMKKTDTRVWDKGNELLKEMRKRQNPAS